MDKAAVAEALERIAQLLALKGENPFKVRAFENAAGAVTGVQDFEALVRDGKLETVKGIGKAIAAEIAALAATGTSPALASLEKEVPASLPDLLRIPGLGTKKAAVLWKDLGVATLGELEYAIRENRLVTLPGFGEKSQQKIDEGLRFVRSTEGRWRLPDAAARAEEAKAFFLSPAAKAAGVSRVEVAGELRRGMRDGLGDRPRRGMRTPGNGSPRFPEKPGAPPVTVDAGRKEDFGNRLLRATGSEARTAATSNRAAPHGALQSPTFEESVLYERLGLPPIPPELREGRGEVALAAAGRLPRLVEAGDIRGPLPPPHDVLRRERDARRDLPSRRRSSATPTSGSRTTPRRPPTRAAFPPGGSKEQWAEIESLREKFPSLTVFRGTEADILPDGSIDYGDDFLAGFDFVIASVHSAFHLAARRADRAARPGGAEPARDDAGTRDGPAPPRPGRVRRGPRRCLSPPPAKRGAASS